ncbi:MAG: ATP-binding cassette domain-containing protein [Deltaproteobacteria bacterium]|nr:ATP-binding cassette domain-containing protein [Deltaproteobacteria bacterium]
MSNTILKIEHLTKRFGGLVAVKDVSFHVNQGEKLGILGPNGAGKTTLFNQISGFITSDEGSILYKGEDIKRLKPHQRADIGMGRTFQLVRPFRGMTVRENLIIPFLSPREKRLLKTQGTSMDETIDDILKNVGLVEKKDMLVEQLPHGELKKLEVAKVSALNPASVEIDMLSEYINFLNHHEKITFVIIEHRLREFMRIVERVVVLNYGELIAEGTPGEIIRNTLVIEAYLGKGGAEIAAA